MSALKSGLEGPCNVLAVAANHAVGNSDIARIKPDFLGLSISPYPSLIYMPVRYHEHKSRTFLLLNTSKSSFIA